MCYSGVFFFRKKKNKSFRVSNFHKTLNKPIFLENLSILDIIRLWRGFDFAPASVRSVSGSRYNLSIPGFKKTELVKTVLLSLNLRKKLINDHFIWFLF